MPPGIEGGGGMGAMDGPVNFKATLLGICQSNYSTEKVKKHARLPWTTLCLASAFCTAKPRSRKGELI